MKCQCLFSGNKNINLSAEIAQKMVIVTLQVLFTTAADEI